MHIITGLIMAGLLKKGKDKEGAPKASASPLLKLAEPVRARHLLPGRARLEVKRLRGDHEAAQKLGESLGRIASVEAVRVSPVTGSVLLRYDAEAISADLLVAAIIRVLGLEDELHRVPSSVVGRELREVSGALNRAVYDRTGGIVDLRTAILLALGAAGLTRLWRGGQLALPAGFTLLWWAGHGLLGKRGDAPC